MFRKYSPVSESEPDTAKMSRYGQSGRKMTLMCPNCKHPIAHWEEDAEPLMVTSTPMDGEEVRAVIKAHSKRFEREILLNVLKREVKNHDCSDVKRLYTDPDARRVWLSKESIEALVDAPPEAFESLKQLASYLKEKRNVG